MDEKVTQHALGDPRPPTRVPSVSRSARAVPARSSGLWADALARLKRDPVTIAAISALGAMIVLAALADVLADHFFRWGFARQDILNNYAPPTIDDPVYWFGGDQLGRSQIVRLLYGARVSLFVGVLGAAVSMTIGIGLGVTAGYFRGWWDDVVIWLVTTLTSIPLLFLLIIVGVLFRLQPVPLAIFLGLLGWMGITNLARGQTLSISRREYVLAARSIGARPARIALRHILPNILPLMIVVAMIDVGAIVLAESAISYLGFGIQPPTPSWGNMLTGAQLHLSRAPWMVYAPGAAVTLAVLCFYLIGDGLRDALDPRLRMPR